LHALQTADDIVHDALVDARVLRLARRGAELISAGKRGGRPSPHQRDINEVLVERARSGRRVLRLKGGDPFVFGRGWDEASALTEPACAALRPDLGLAAARGRHSHTSRDTNPPWFCGGIACRGRALGRRLGSASALGQPILLI
jgi:uroporphyrin-III C-methyltransferase